MELKFIIYTWKSLGSTYDDDERGEAWHHDDDVGVFFFFIGIRAEVWDYFTHSVVFVVNENDDGTRGARIDLEYIFGFS